MIVALGMCIHPLESTGHSERSINLVEDDRGYLSQTTLALEQSQQGKWIKTRQHNPQVKAKAKAHQLVLFRQHVQRFLPHSVKHLLRMELKVLWL